MHVTLRRIDPASLAKIYAVVYGLLMLVVALPAGCMVALFGSTGELGGLGAGIGLAAVILYPVFGALAGFVGGLLTAFAYNLVADRIGGVQLEMDGLGEVPIL